MSKIEFTPGPWFLDPRAVAYIRSNDHAIANASCWDTNLFDPRPEQEANAHLIAAAPDLYAQLERMIRECESDIHDKYDGFSNLDAHLAITKDARAALAKARGELAKARGELAKARGELI